MYQIIQSILSDPQDKTEISLIFANVTEDDILLRQELDAWAVVYKKQFKVYYVLDKPPSSKWVGGSGYVTPSMLRDQLFAPGSDAMVLCCGPPMMVNKLNEHLVQLGHSKANIFTF